MQAPQVNCVAAALARFCTAARNMEQAVMIPSLLREVGVEESANTPSSEAKDMYELYVKLKNIRMTLEHGVVPAGVQNTDSEEKTANAGNNEGMIYHHLAGLFCILGQLTKESNALTSRYNDLIGTPEGR
ncbi:thyroid hormone-inducible hepatic protein [Spea bombifrons]|uniref:thyroid hormone-inducible hepatic protein n=1 Tax=Spea bombifrons TaxID=233779 RepID=UPI00234BBB07|nr:thyroid hormone-inducible hepatic protein [Spea bombifrons]